MKAAVRHQLDPTIRSNDTCDFHSSPCGQRSSDRKEGVQSLVDMFQVFCAGLNLAQARPGREPAVPGGRPVQGKNAHCGKRLRKILFWGMPAPVIKVDLRRIPALPTKLQKLNRFTSRAIWAHRETHPLNHSGSLWRRVHTEKLKAQLPAFRREIGKRPSDALWQLLAGNAG